MVLMGKLNVVRQTDTDINKNDSDWYNKYNRVRYERGFISYIQCSADWWLDNADNEIKQNPISDVTVGFNGITFQSDYYIDADPEITQHRDNGVIHRPNPTITVASSRSIGTPKELSERWPTVARGLLL